MRATPPLRMLFCLSMAYVFDLTDTFDRVQAHNKSMLVLYKSIWNLEANEFAEEYEAIGETLGTKTLRVSSILCDENPQIC